MSDKFSREIDRALFEAAQGLEDAAALDAFLASDQPEGRKLAIVGGADHETEYVRHLRARASDRIVFLGFQPRPVIKSLYEQCALFVMPSYHEGLPIAALEAASCSAPMILSDIPANRDLGLAASHYFPVGDTDRLAHLLEREHVSNPAEAEMVRRRFDWDRAADSTAKIYRSLIPPAVVAPQRERIGTGLVE